MSKETKSKDNKDGISETVLFFLVAPIVLMVILFTVKVLFFGW